MTDPTADALVGVRDQLVAMRADLSTMVTRREHEAEVRRLDAETAHVRASLAQHELAEDRRLDEVETRHTEGMDKVLATITAAENARKAEAKAAVDQRKADRRWSAGFVLTAAGVASGVVGLILR